MKLPNIKDVEEAHEEFGYFLVKWAKHFYNEGIKDATHIHGYRTKDISPIDKQKSIGSPYTSSGKVTR